MADGANLRLVLVTPERKVLEETCRLGLAAGERGLRHHPPGPRAADRDPRHRRPHLEERRPLVVVRHRRRLLRSLRRPRHRAGRRSAGARGGRCRRGAPRARGGQGRARSLERRGAGARAPLIERAEAKLAIVGSSSSTTRRVLDPDPGLVAALLELGLDQPAVLGEAEQGRRRRRHLPPARALLSLEAAAHFLRRAHRAQRDVGTAGLGRPEVDDRRRLVRPQVLREIAGQDAEQAASRICARSSSSGRIWLSIGSSTSTVSIVSAAGAWTRRRSAADPGAATASR